MKTAVIYARYSSERQTEQSIEGQLSVCNDYAKKHNILIIDTYIDRAMTGTNDRRDAFQKMMHDSAKKAWDYVLVYKFDRFSRDKYESTIHKHTLKENGVKLISAMENIPDSPEGIILESLLEGMNQYYSMELAQKVRRGMNESRRKGHFTGGNILYGYKVVDKKIEVDEDAAEIVRYIFKRAANGDFMKDIQADLNEKGILNHGHTFGLNTLYCMLRNEKYIGIHRVGDEVFTNTYAQIVPTELFNFVRQRTEENKYGRHSKEVIYLLKNRAFCGYCGAPYSSDCGTSKNGTLKRYYKCRAKKKGSHVCDSRALPKEPLEKLIVDVTLKVMGDENLLDAIADKIIEMNHQQVADNFTLNILINEQQETKKAIDNIMRAIEQGIFTHTTKARLAELEQKMEDYELKIAQEKSEQQLQISRSDILRYIKLALKKKPLPLIRLLIKKIVVYNDKIEIYYNYANKPDDNSRRAFCFYEEEIDLTYNSARIVEFGEIEQFTAIRHFNLKMWI